MTDFVVVSDVGLMSGKNISLLKSAGYKFILGERIKKEAGKVKEWLFSLEKRDGSVYDRILDTDEQIIVSYSKKRASKDSYNRQKGIERLEKSYKSGKVNKKNINRRGYNKFLKIENDVLVSIDYERIKEDERWDGWKSYVTNAAVPARFLIWVSHCQSQQYTSLYQHIHFCNSESCVFTAFSTS